MPDPIRLQYLLQKYINNSCSSEEFEEFWLYMSELSEDKLLFPDLQKLWNEKSLPPQYSGHVDWNSVYHRLQEKVAGQASRKQRARVILRRRVMQVGFAASILLCVILTAIIFHTRPGDDLNSIKTEKLGSVLRSITLPDGSKVTLNKGSRLDYKNSFNASTREVFLSGEAYFDVSHDAGRPFLVHTGKFVTRVLGTAFNVKAYDDDPDLQVSVTRGKVQVQDADDMKSLGFLTPGDQLIIHKLSSETVFKKVDVQKVIQWKEQELVFDNVRFADAARRIEHRYKVKIRFANDALGNCRFTGNFEQESLEQTLEIICALTRSDWEKGIGNDIIIKGEGCP